MGAAFVLALCMGMGLGEVGLVLLLGFIVLPAFMGFLIILDGLGVLKGLLVNAAFLLLGIYVNPWIFWGWFAFLSLIGSLVLLLMFLSVFLPSGVE